MTSARQHRPCPHCPIGQSVIALCDLEALLSELWEGAGWRDESIDEDMFLAALLGDVDAHPVAGKQLERSNSADRVFRGVPVVFEGLPDNDSHSRSPAHIVQKWTEGYATSEGAAQAREKSVSSYFYCDKPIHVVPKLETSRPDIFGLQLANEVCS